MRKVLLLFFITSITFAFSQIKINTPKDIVVCDSNNDGIEYINLTQSIPEIIGGNNYSVAFYSTQAEAQSGINQLNTNFNFNLQPITLFVRVNTNDGTFSLTTLSLKSTSCNGNEDNDLVTNAMEDVNFDGNFKNDDTDKDGIANYVDNDDDGDGVLTKAEDYNKNGDPKDDDINNNGIADYLDNTIALSTSENQKTSPIQVYPNLVNDFVNILTSEKIKYIDIISITGQKIFSIKNKKIDLSQLKKGVYILKIITDNKENSLPILKN